MTTREQAVLDMFVEEFRDFRKEYREDQQATNARLLSLESTRTEQRTLERQKGELEKAKADRHASLRAWMALAATVSGVIVGIIVKFL